MDIETIGIHESVGVVFPPEVLAGSMGDVDPEVAVVGTEDLDRVDALVTFDYDPVFLDHVSWIHTIQAGYDKFPLPDLEATDVTLTNSAGIHGESVGETVTGMMLAFARGLHRYVRTQAEHSWDRAAWDDPFTLFGESACVIGLGTLGQGIAQRAAGMEMDVTGVRRKPTRVPHVREVYTPDRLHEAIGEARFVAISVPLTEETEGMFGAAEFEAMREDAYLINVARGQVVDEAALVEAIEAGQIAGAGLDVFETEPLPSDSPLWDMDEVIVTPHVAAMTRDYYREIEALVRENLALLTREDDPVNKVV